MLNITSRSLAAIVSASAAPAGACHDVEPTNGQAGDYEAIFVGEVTGIRLRSYENRQLGRADACSIEEDGVESVCFNIMSDPLVSIFALPRIVVRGNIDVQELNEAGCNKTDLALKNRGIFFVNPSGGSAAIVWEGESAYEDWLKELGVDAGAR